MKKPNSSGAMSAGTLAILHRIKTSDHWPKAKALSPTEREHLAEALTAAANELRALNNRPKRSRKKKPMLELPDHPRFRLN
jgi:hypothetical protein